MGLLRLHRRQAGVELRPCGGDQPVARPLPADVEEQGARERLEAGREDGRPVRPLATRLALAELEVGAEIDPSRQRRQPGRTHDGGAARGEHALVVVGVADIEGLGDGEVDHGIAKEFEPFVVPGGLAGVLVEPGGVRQRLGEQAPVPNGEPELPGELVSPVHDPGWIRTRLGVALVDVFDGVADGADALRVLVGDLGPELFLEAHDQLDQVERVGVQVVDERRLGLDVLFIDAELLDDDFLESIVGAGH